MSLSATGINLTMVVDGDQVKPAMQRLHDAFFAERRRMTQRSVAIIGDGKMGAGDRASSRRSAAGTCRGDRSASARAQAEPESTARALGDADVAVEFTEPDAAVGKHYGAACRAGVPVVVGTTGWYDALPEIDAHREGDGDGAAHGAELLARRELF